jgi:hypothetical protein
VTRATDALEDVQRVQLEIREYAGPDLSKLVGTGNDKLTIDKLAAQMTTELYGDEKSRTPERARDAGEYDRLVRTIAYQWLSTYRMYGQRNQKTAAAAWEIVSDRAATSLRNDWLFVLAVQLFNVFVLPGLGMVLFFRAALEIEGATDEARRGFTSFARAIAHRRNRHLLVIGQRWYLFRRYALGSILVLGTTYMFAPRGQLASALGSYPFDAAIPGTESIPYYAEHFIDAPLLVTGFVGYLLYLITESLHRAFTGNLNDRFTLSLLNRGLVVGLLGMVLSAVADGADGARALIFVVGIFPQRGIEWLSKKASLTPEGLLGATSKFDVLPEIDDDKITVLREVGIDGLHDLARCDLERVVIDVGIDANVLCRAADRALLIDTFGLEGAKKLEALPVFTASELVLFISLPAESVVSVREGLIAETKAARSADPTKPRPNRLDIRKVARRTEAQRNTQMEKVVEKLGAVDVSVQLAMLEDDDNVQYILHQVFAYEQR